MLPGKIILVTGGARSGKSEIAEQLAGVVSERVIYIATAAVHDEEMADRVRRHRERRPPGWCTVEETHRLAEALAGIPAGSCVLVDCLTMWISNILMDESLFDDNGLNNLDQEEYILAETGKLLATARQRGLTLVLVSNEVGCGVVPASKLGRLFRDIAGRVNRRVAAEADRVYLVMAGIPVEIKSLAVNVEREEI